AMLRLRVFEAFASALLSARKSSISVNSTARSGKERYGNHLQRRVRRMGTPGICARKVFSFL
ncbi:MAG TPA: hypothetical protein VMS21_14420, partial [Methylomirabilota bacterium]|nr:hypothetical protein [Methylomirabilota bacterium]